VDSLFKQLKDKNYFKQVKPFFCGIVWPNEQDLSADTIAYELKQTD
jgi:preprotein translocase subunit SecE